MRWLALACLLVASVARADDAQPDARPAPPKTPFDRGRVGLSLGGGTQTLLGQQYFALGGGAEYFVLDGVGIGASGLIELGNDPTIGKLAPSLRYVAQPLVGTWPLIPYVGAFYNHWFIGGAYDDVDTIGGRAGLLYVSGSVVLGLGVAAEHVVSACTESATTSCNLVYPDLTISLSL